MNHAIFRTFFPFDVSIITKGDWNVIGKLIFPFNKIDEFVQSASMGVGLYSL